MKNKQDFILNVEMDGSISSLNRFVHRRFDRDTTVWSDRSGHNILLFVLDGDAVCSRSDFSVVTTLHRKVTVLGKGDPFVVDFRSGCDILSYSFESYAPVDLSLYDLPGPGIESVAGEGVAFDIPAVLHRLLVDIAENIGFIGDNETLTHLAMRKVTGAMHSCLKPAHVGVLLSIGGSELRSEIVRYMKIAESRLYLTKKPAKVIF